MREELPDADDDADATAEVVVTMQPPGCRRDRVLPLLIAVTKDRLGDPSKEAARLIVSQLGAALRAERQRGRNGHWSYSLTRHLALCRAYAAECRRLRQAYSAHGSSTAARSADT